LKEQGNKASLGD
jgi:hypothetical protein